jgi:hypothetical protein
VLQQLDLCSLASLAVSCSEFRQAIPASMCQLSVRCNSWEAFNSFSSWLQQNRANLDNMTQCSVVSIWQEKSRINVHSTLQSLFQRMPGPSSRILHLLPCPQLRQLQLKDLHVQLAPSEGCPGVLHDCTGLTSLDLQGCWVPDMHTSMAAIAALPELQSLNMGHIDISDGRGLLLLPELQHASQFTRLGLTFRSVGAQGMAQLSQLSAMVNLQHLRLTQLHSQGVPGGVPPQLVKLTCLHVSYNAHSQHEAAAQLQHLSALTELRDLQMECSKADAAALSDLEHTSQLKSLDLRCDRFEFTSSSTHRWAHLSALESLTLGGCRVQPAAFAALKQLRALSLLYVQFFQHSRLLDLLATLAQLPVLADLAVQYDPHWGVGPPTAPFTAPWISTQLHSLQLGVSCRWSTQDLASGLIRPGTVCPQLHFVDLCYRNNLGAVRLSEPQLQQLCSSCAAAALHWTTWHCQCAQTLHPQPWRLCCSCQH